MISGHSLLRINEMYFQTTKVTEGFSMGEYIYMSTLKHIYIYEALAIMILKKINEYRQVNGSSTRLKLVV